MGGGGWLSPTFEGMVAIDGLLEPEAGHTLLAALEPLARPTDAQDVRSGGQRTADALAELARRALEAGRLPKTGGVRPQLLVTVSPGRHGARVRAIMPIAMFAPRYAVLAWALMIPLRLVMARFAHR
jgi:Domain of unknown function (DUF222)